LFLFELEQTPLSGLVPMAESFLVKGLIVGAAAGVAVAFASHAMKRKKEEVMDLGYDWPRIKNDPELTRIMHELKGFSKVSPELYMELGNTCNAMLDLYATVADPSVVVSHNYIFKALLYRTSIDKALSHFSIQLSNYRQYQPTLSGASASLASPPASEGRLVVTRFYLLADELSTAMKTHYQNISQAVQDKGNPTKRAAGNTGRGLAASSAPAEPIDEDLSKDSAFHADVQSLVSACTVVFPTNEARLVFVRSCNAIVSMWTVLCDEHKSKQAPRDRIELALRHNVDFLERQLAECARVGVVEPSARIRAHLFVYSTGIANKLFVAMPPQQQLPQQQLQQQQPATIVPQ